MNTKITKTYSEEEYMSLVEDYKKLQEEMAYMEDEMREMGGWGICSRLFCRRARVNETARAHG